MIAALHIQTASRNDRTYLRRAYYTTPFKVASITEDRNQRILHLMLITSSPGILDGDNYKLKIEIDEDCHLQLHTQSFQRLFEMKKEANQTMEVMMKENSTFCYLPHPTVPLRSSNFTSKSKIYLSKRCALIWGEVLTCGRKLSGEEFKFSKYHAVTEIFLDRRLIVKENLFIQPDKVDINAIGQLEGYTHQASLIYISNRKDIKTAITDIPEWLSSLTEITFGVTALQINGLVIRLLGYKAEQLHNILKQAASRFQIDKDTSADEITPANEIMYAI